MELELFNDQGCLTDEGLQALIAGSLDEMGRLEAVEHLAYCDRCLKRYTDLLSGEVLLEPPKDLSVPVRRGLMMNLMHTVWGRGVVAAAAVLLSLGMWHSGFFDYSGLNNHGPKLPAISQPSGFSQASDAFFDAFSAFRRGLSQTFTLSPATQEEGHSHET